MERKFDFAIIGAQKSGSTSLQNGLSSNPNISLLSGELDCFDKPGYTSERYSLESLNENVKFGFKRPNLLLSASAPKTLKAYNEKIRVVVILRNPVKRFYSAYVHMRRLGYLPSISPDKLLDQIQCNYTDPRYPRVSELVEYGMYYKGLSNWLDEFDDESICIVNFEEYILDPYACYKKICGHIGVIPVICSSIKKGLAKRSNRGAVDSRSLSAYEQLNKLVYDYSDPYKRKLKYPKKPELVVRSLYWFLRARYFRYFGISQRYDSSDLNKRLREIYKDDQECLIKLIEGICANQK